MKCNHITCEKIIDTNYQCTSCGEILTSETYKEFALSICSNCNGVGFFYDYDDKHLCDCIKQFEFEE